MANDTGVSSDTLERWRNEVLAEPALAAVAQPLSAHRFTGKTDTGRARPRLSAWCNARPMAALDLRTFEGIRLATYPSRLPLLHLDRIFVRGLRPVSAHVPHGRVWSRMSDHLPLIAELEL